MVSGEVKIREQVVVRWEAVCTGPTEGWEGRWNYTVTATGNHTGRNFTRTWTLPHERNAGPYVLASAVMVDIEIMMKEEG